MFFNDKDEIILKDGSTESFISGEEKLGLSRHLNSVAKDVTVKRGKYLRYKNDELNVIEEAINRAPMFCNALMSRGYKNILFVGHYNDHQTHWMLDKFAGRMVDVLPEEREDMQTFPDLNIVSQFIPLVLRMMRYDVSFVTWWCFMELVWRLPRIQSIVSRGSTGRMKKLWSLGRWRWLSSSALNFHLEVECCVTPLMICKSSRYDMMLNDETIKKNARLFD